VVWYYHRELIKTGSLMHVHGKVTDKSGSSSEVDHVPREFCSANKGFVDP